MNLQSLPAALKFKQELGRRKLTGPNNFASEELKFMPLTCLSKACESPADQIQTPSCLAGPGRDGAGPHTFRSARRSKGRSRAFSKRGCGTHDEKVGGRWETSPSRNSASARSKTFAVARWPTEVALVEDRV